MDAIVDVLRKAPLFRDVPDEALRRFAALGTTRDYPAGEIIFAEMTEGDEIFLVLEGTISAQLALANADQSYEIIKLGPGEVFGEVAFVDETQRSATVTAETDVRVLVWRREDVHAACEKDPQLGYRLMYGIARVLAQRLRRWNVRLLENSLWGFE
jgi:CRP-like cAMP-binding protein